MCQLRVDKLRVTCDNNWQVHSYFLICAYIGFLHGMSESESMWAKSTNFAKCSAHRDCHLACGKKEKGIEGDESVAFLKVEWLQRRFAHNMVHRWSWMVIRKVYRCPTHFMSSTLFTFSTAWEERPVPKMWSFHQNCAAKGPYITHEFNWVCGLKFWITILRPSEVRKWNPLAMMTIAYVRLDSSKFERKCRGKACRGIWNVFSSLV